MTENIRWQLNCHQYLVLKFMAAIWLMFMLFRTLKSTCILIALYEIPHFYGYGLQLYSVIKD